MVSVSWGLRWEMKAGADWRAGVHGHLLFLPAQHPFPHRLWQLPDFSLSNHPWPTGYVRFHETVSARVPSCPQAKGRSHDSSCTNQKLSLEFELWAYVTGRQNLVGADSCSSQGPEETAIPSCSLDSHRCPGSSLFWSRVLRSFLPLCVPPLLPSNKFLACLS